MLDNLDISGKVVAVRVDFNVPLNDAFEVTDNTRIRKALPTIQNLVQRGARVVLMSHLGRPLRKLKEDGTVDRDKFTLNHIVPELSRLLGQPIRFVDDCVGEKVRDKIATLSNGDILVLENTRFYPEETSGDEKFAKALAANADLYVNDAFGTAHRAHASTAVMAQEFGANDKDFGFLMGAEIENASKVLDNPQSPYIAVLGGAKVSDKILLIEQLLEKADELIIGGGMAYTFVKALGGQIGKSLVEEDKLDLAKELMAKAKERGKKIHLPADSAIASGFKDEDERRVVRSDAIPGDWMALDIGDEAIRDYGSVIAKAKTILWNGPMGVFEFGQFAKGTMDIAKSIAKATETNGAFSMVGGGDSVAAVNKSGLADKISFISTGGGAMLEFLEGKTLPGIAAIRRK